MSRLFLILVLTLAVAPAFARSAERPLDFNRDIRPILSENCFQCHCSIPSEDGIGSWLRNHTMEGICRKESEKCNLSPILGTTLFLLQLVSDGLRKFSHIGVYFEPDTTIAGVFVNMQMAPFPYLQGDSFFFVEGFAAPHS